MDAVQQATRVWIVPDRSRSSYDAPSVYHRDPTCPSLQRSSGGTFALKKVELRSVRGRRRCTRCWQDLEPWDLLAQDTEREGDSAAEVDFVRQVLSRATPLRAADVEVQKTLKLSDGTEVRPDFVIHRDGRQVLAIELDGYDKSPIKQPIEVHRDDAAKRRHIEQELGLPVITFTNIDLATPDAAIRDMQSRLASLSYQDDVSPGRRWRRTAAVVLGALALGLVAWWSVDALRDPGGQVEPSSDGSCPAEAPVKGNDNVDGELIYHRPDWRYYDATSAEACFETPADAESAGYRPSEIR